MVDTQLWGSGNAKQRVDDDWSAADSVSLLILPIVGGSGLTTILLLSYSPGELVQEVVEPLTKVHNNLQQRQVAASQPHPAQAVDILQELAQAVRLPVCCGGSTGSSGRVSS